MRLRAAGRTDTGVHATGQVAHVDVPVDALPNAYPRSPRADRAGIPAAGPAAGPVPAYRCPGPPTSSERQRVSTPGSRRCAAITSTGCPRALRRGAAAGPLCHRLAAGAGCRCDGSASRDLLGLHDFAAFCRQREGATTIRDLQRLDWERDGDLITAHVTADAFCWSMVRSLVGALLAVGEHRRAVTWCRDLLTATRRSSDFAAAPAHGLTLIGVDYPPDDELASRILITRDLRSRD